MRSSVARTVFASLTFAFAHLAVSTAAELPQLPATIDRIRPSIVAIGTNLPTRNPSFQFRGTGFVVRDGTLVATNNHVLPGAVDPGTLETLAIAVPQGNGEAQVREATILVRDTEHDVAVLRIGGAPLPAVRLGDASQIREGQTYAFTGFPIGSVIGLYPTTHHALISALTPVALAQPNSRSLDAALIRRLRSERFVIFQLDATAYPGNSGSPMFNPDNGEVIAIINMVLVKGGKETALSQPSGISYAIPITWLAKLLEGL